jgi:hypothetical protein
MNDDKVVPIRFRWKVRRRFGIALDIHADGTATKYDAEGNAVEISAEEVRRITREAFGVKAP